VTKRNNRSPTGGLPVLLALLLPGGGLFFWGISSCAATRHFGMPGALGALAGLCLVLAGGCCHYRADYRDRTGNRSFAAFAGLTAFSALAAYLVNHVLFR
jgi:hypothetical protein